MIKHCIAKYSITMITVLCAVLICTNSLSATVTRYSDRDDVRVFIERLAAEHDFNQAELLGLMRRVNKQSAVLQAIAKPAERELSWREYRKIFIQPQRIQQGGEFWRQHAASLAKAEQEYGVPPELVVAIIGVETRYGKYTGKYPVLDSLVTLAFDGERRQAFFRRELEAFLLLARDEKVDPFSINGSYAGAMGIPQFIASSYRSYAVDFDGDGRRDLWNNPVDAIGSVANYFKRHGWRNGEAIVSRAQFNNANADIATLESLAVGRDRKGLKPKQTYATFINAGLVAEPALPTDSLVTLIKFADTEQDEYWLGAKNFYVITRYNHSAMYAMAVYQLAQLIKQDRAQ